MIIFVLLLFALCLYNLKTIKAENGEIGIFSDYLSIEKTNSIKGIFILIVFLQHFNQYVTYTSWIDVEYLKYFNLIGQRMVTLFLFYSGFGIMESITKKGKNYIMSIPIKRIGGVLFRFDIAVVLYLVLDFALYFKNFPYSIKDIILSFIGWSSIGNSSWYIFTIIFAYFFTYISFALFQKNRNNLVPIILVIIFCLAYCIVMRKVKASYWYDTLLCFPLGMIWSQYKGKIEKLFSNFFIWIISIIALLGAQVISIKYNHIFVVVIAHLAFALIVVMVTMKISINNKPLNWCGKHLFGIFILQRIPMIILNEVGSVKINVYLYFVLCLAITVLLTRLFDYFVDKLWNKLINR